MSTTTAIWKPNFADNEAPFQVLAGSILRLQIERFPTWPTRAELGEFLTREHIVNARGNTLRPVEPPAQPGHWQTSYEASIYLRGDLPVYDNSWHDFFQILVWATFPDAKRALNAVHYAALRARMESQDPGRRAPRENALTLFDENGAIVLASDPTLLDHIRRFEWKTLFWDRRRELSSKLRCIVFGHALYEKLLQPYVGLCAHATLMLCDESMLNQAAGQLIPQIDQRLAATVSDDQQITAPRDLAPFPVLGLPGWYDNDRADFYDNQNYFRQQRTRQI